MGWKALPDVDQSDINQFTILHVAHDLSLFLRTSGLQLLRLISALLDINCLCTFCNQMDRLQTEA